MTNDTKTKTTYCPTCDAEREVRITVPGRTISVSSAENVDG